MASKASDGDPATRWCAADGASPQYWQVDLGKESIAGFLRIVWEKQAALYQFEVGISRDGMSWVKPGANREGKGKVSELTFPPQSFRYLRITITGIQAKEIWACICEVELLDKQSQASNPYYRIIDAYRLLWSDVPFESGELKAIAYQNGKAIGEDTVKTAGKAAKLRLAADRPQLLANGFDLSYVAIELLDAEGNVCPHAKDMLQFETTGPVELKGVDNGDPMGTDSFTDHQHPLFHGKAVAVLRALPGQPGSATLKVRCGTIGETLTLTTTKP